MRGSLKVDIMIITVKYGCRGQKYLIHPLDLSIISDPVRINGKQYTACISSFVGADNWAEGAFDISLGDAFLRNVYSVYDISPPLLSIHTN